MKLGSATEKSVGNHYSIGSLQAMASICKNLRKSTFLGYLGFPFYPCSPSSCTGERTNSTRHSSKHKATCYQATGITQWGAVVAMTWCHTAATLQLTHYIRGPWFRCSLRIFLSLAYSFNNWFLVSKWKRVLVHTRSQRLQSIPRIPAWRPSYTYIKEKTETNSWRLT